MMRKIGATLVNYHNRTVTIADVRQKNGKIPVKVDKSL